MAMTLSELEEGLEILARIWRAIVRAGEEAAYRLPRWCDIPIMALAYTVALAAVVLLPMVALALSLLALGILLPILAIGG